MLFLPLKVFFTIIWKKVAIVAATTANLRQEGKYVSEAKKPFLKAKGTQQQHYYPCKKKKKAFEPQPFAFQFFLFISN